MTTPPEDKHDVTEENAEAIRAEETAQATTGISPRVRLGERLSQARQTHEMSLSEASERLRIRANYLEALESGDWTPLPEEVYVMGFLRQYAGLLGVDISADIEALKPGEYQLTKPFTMPDPPIAMNRAWAITAAACFFVLLILFNVVDEGEKERIPAQPPATLPLTEQQAPAQTEGQVAVMTEEPARELSAPLQETDTAETNLNTPTPQAASPDEIAGPDQATSVKAVSDQHAAATTAPEDQVSVVSVIEHEASADQSGEAAQTTYHSYQISAVDQDVWLQVHAPDGSLVKEALLRGGQSMVLSSSDAYLLLTAGNPLALSISIDGNNVAAPGTLGEKDKVLHDHRLDPASH